MIFYILFLFAKIHLKKIVFKHYDIGFCIELPIQAERLKFNYRCIPTIERKRLAGKIKVRSFVDGYKILKSMILIFFTSRWKNL